MLSRPNLWVGYIKSEHMVTNLEPVITAVYPPDTNDSSAPDWYFRIECPGRDSVQVCTQLESMIDPDTSTCHGYTQFVIVYCYKAADAALIKLVFPYNGNY